jgi:hypothetical protein
MNPAITCKVLNRLANRHSRESLRELNTLLDHATQLLWRKQENFLGDRRHARYPEQSGMNGTTIEFNM